MSPPCCACRLRYDQEWRIVSTFLDFVIRSQTAYHDAGLNILWRLSIDLSISWDPRSAAHMILDVRLPQPLMDPASGTSQEPTSFNSWLVHSTAMLTIAYANFSGIQCIFRVLATPRERGANMFFHHRMTLLDPQDTPPVFIDIK